MRPNQTLSFEMQKGKKYLGLRKKISLVGLREINTTFFLA
jgi:hypothetical protein